MSDDEKRLRHTFPVRVLLGLPDDEDEDAPPVTTPDDLDDDDLVEIHCAAEDLDPDLFDPWSGDDA